MKNFLRRTVKDVVFHNAIATEENIPEIYRALHPEDEREIDPNDFQIINKVTLIINGITNNLSFLKISDNKMIFVETQSSWNVDNLERFANYVLTILSNIQDASIFDFDIEIFILSTSGKEPKKITLKLRENLKIPKELLKFVPEYEFTVVSRKNKNVPDKTIIDEYFKFTEIQMEIYRKYGRNRIAYNRLLGKCFEEDILVDFLKANKEVLMINFNEIYNQEKINRIEKKRYRLEGKDEGLIEGKAKGRIEGRAEGRSQERDRIFKNLINEGISIKKARELVYSD